MQNVKFSQMLNSIWAKKVVGWVGEYIISKCISNSGWIIENLKIQMWNWNWSSDQKCRYIKTLLAHYMKIMFNDQKYKEKEIHM